MEANVFLPTESIEDCDCCRTFSEQPSHEYGCEERKAVFTRREQEVLRHIREASLRARMIREELRMADRGETIDAAARERALSELENLKRMRADLETERIAAAEERMRLLGHLS